MSVGMPAAELQPGFRILRLGEHCKVTEVGTNPSGSLVIVKGLRSDGATFKSRYTPRAVVTVVARAP